MNRQVVLEKLKAAKPVLGERYGVTRLALFGSTARDEASADSDVDIVVGFDGPATSARYFGVQFYLEDELGCAVDLVTEKAMRAELRPYIEREALNV
jgi:predicted nucleotidyltransferase